MFISTFEELRKNIIETQTISSMLHLSRGVFGADFGSSSTIFKKDSISNYRGIYFRLVERTFQEFNQKHLKILFEKTLKDHSFRFNFAKYTKDVEDIIFCIDGAKILYDNVDQQNFKKIPGCPIGYWASNKIIKLFIDNKLIGSVCLAKQGLATADNNRFLRNWFEVNYNKIGFLYSSTEETKDGIHKWFPYNKGGESRKWYGNQNEIVDWEYDGERIKNNFDDRGKLRSRPQNTNYYFRSSISWSLLASNGMGFRFYPAGFIYDVNGMSLFTEVPIFQMLAFLNSNLTKYLLQIINPTMACQIGDLLKIPSCLVDIKTENINSNISISKQDWDAHETSWDFEENELVGYVNEAHKTPVECTFKDEEGQLGSYSSDAKPSFYLDSLYEEFKTKWTEKFIELHTNEEELNRQFIEIYGLEDELTPDVPLDEITILQQGEVSIENNDIVWHSDVVMKQFISYAIGCMMGRYRLDKKGLCIAHPNPSAEEIAPYDYHGFTFEIDDDGIIPLMAKDSRFDDNGVNRLTDFVKLVFGEETLTDNMNYLEEALGKSVEQYLIKDFWKDHKKMYQNRPIYWLFSSKKGAFQVITYMHRMNKYTVENIRNKYLLPHIEYLRQELAGLDSRITALTPQERKQYQKLQKDLEECMEYHDRLHSVADQQIDFDLDDGVVVNYAKFGDVLAKLK